MDDDGKKVWELISTKTNDHIRVPIIEQANRILEKYAGYPTPIPILSNQKMNQSLKELGKLAILNKSTKILRYFDGQKQETFVPFYQVLTTHVARKSFITNALMLGVPERIVREVSGHKDEKSFGRYVKLVDSYKDEVIRGAFEGMEL